jgi:hypothetical protein
MTAFKKIFSLLAFLFVFALAAQTIKKQIPENKTIAPASEAIDATIKDAKPNVTRESTPTTPTTTTTTPTSTTTTPTSTSTPTSTTSTTTTTTTTTSIATSESNTVTTVPSETKSALYVNFKSTFDLISQDDLSTVDFVEYRINDGEYIKYTGPISLSKEGPTTITYRAIDKVGNRENAQILNVIVDNTPPVASLKPLDPVYMDKGTIFASPKTRYGITAEDSSAGVKEIIYYIDNDPKQKYTGNPITINKSGFHVINYFAVDNAGNQSNEQSYVVNVDAGKPTVEIIESQPFIKVNDKTFARVGTTFKVTAKDGESGVAKVLVKVDDATEFVPYVEDLAFNTSGEHKISAKAIDNVGNESDVVTITFFYDIKPPQTSIKAVSN